MVVKNNHKPIIDKRLFVRAQQRLAGNTSKQTKQTKARYDLSGKISCGECAKNFVARKKRKKDGLFSVRWRCYEAVMHGKKQAEQGIGCHNSSMGDPELRYMIQFLLEQLQVNAEVCVRKIMPQRYLKKPWMKKVLQTYKENIAAVCFGPFVEKVVVYKNGKIEINLSGIATVFFFWVYKKPIGQEAQKSRQLFTV